MYVISLFMQRLLSLQFTKTHRLIVAALSLVLALPLVFPPAPVMAQALPAQKPQVPSPVLSDDGVLRSFPESGARSARYAVRIPVTAYSSTPDQTDDTPFTTASGTQVRWGVVAANFLPIGTLVRIPDHFGDQVFVVEDRMNARYNVHLDIWMQTRQEAKQWGLRQVRVEVL